MEKRLFIVSNRLPITVCAESGIKQASGGLITAINSFLEGKHASDFDHVVWAGVPGCNVGTWMAAQKKITPTSFTYLPVFVPNKEYEGYYNGLSNSVLWPLFHYFPSYAEYDVQCYEQYKAVNGYFAETLLKSCDLVTTFGYTTIIFWPGCINTEANAGVTIGFPSHPFLH